MRVNNYISEIDENLFFTKKQIKQDVDRLAANLWIQFGVELFNTHNTTNYNVTDFTWSTSAKAHFYKANLQIVRKLVKSHQMSWFVLQIEPKDEDIVAGSDILEQVLAKKRRKKSKTERFNLFEESI